MNNNFNQPGEFDAVLGGEQQNQNYAVVLGGIEGIKNRLNSEDDEVRIAALEDALKYSDAGVNLIIEALYDPSEEIHNRAIGLLHKAGIKGKHALLDYDPWLVLTTFKNWRDYYYDWIKDQRDKAYCLNSKNYVNSKNKLLRFLKDSKVKNIEAIKCQMYYKDTDCKTAFQDFADTLVKARELLTNLKAVLIGDNCDLINIKYRESNINVTSIHPLLKAYPNLELLHIRGRMLEEDILKPELKIVQVRNNHNNSNITIKPLKHENLKTLIVDADGISDSNISKVCNLNLPSLEYFELWLSRSDLSNINIDNLAPVLSGESFPNLVYLAVRKCGNMSEVAQAIVNSPIMENLKILELTDGNISNGGVLLNSPAINRLHTLDVSGNRLHKNTIEQLSTLKCRVIADSQFSDRYYSVWE
ncbi:HEAT repeat domain-containing protein [Nostoc sp.]|uniref:HEAT repeat domain-containing protein n=1 Tax=Nostoc sp. TaxID=1180 RepID=UPI002FFBA944